MVGLLFQALLREGVTTKVAYSQNEEHKKYINNHIPSEEMTMKIY